MRIVKIIPTLTMAGAEKFVVDLANSMSYDNEVILITIFKSDNDYLEKRVNEKVNFIKLDFDLSRKVLVIYSIYKILKKLKPDVIHTHLSALLYIIPFMLMNKANVFHTIHNMATTEAPRLNRLLNKFAVKLKLVQLISISNEVHESVKMEYNCEPIKIENGTTKVSKTSKYQSVLSHIESLKSNLEIHTGVRCKRVLLSIARIDRQKNQELLIDSIPTDGSILVLMLGHCADYSDDYASRVLYLIKKSEHLHYLGVVENIADYILCSDGIVFSSIYEGLPISLIESMSAGKVSISTPAGGIPDVVIDDVTGFLSSDFTKKTFEKKILKYLSCDDKIIMEMGKCAMQRYEDYYSISKCKDEHIRAYSL